MRVNIDVREPASVGTRAHPHPHVGSHKTKMMGMLQRLLRAYNRSTPDVAEAFARLQPQHSGCCRGFCAPKTAALRNACPLHLWLAHSVSKRKRIQHGLVSL
jgi:hypothetical protein